MIVATRYFYKILLFVLIFVRAQCDLENDEMAERLDSMLMGIKTQRYSRELDDGLKLWQDYEFETGAGNREELIVTNIHIEDEESLSINAGIKNWQYSPGLHHGILAGSEESSLLVYFHDNQNGGLKSTIVLRETGTISTFKVINLSNPATNVEDVIAVSCIKSASETRLNWYRLTSSEFEIISSSPVSRHVESLDFFRSNGRNKLLIVNEPVNQNSAEFSSIEIYGFEFVEGLLEFWLCQSIWVPTISSIEICSVYESTFLSIQSQDTLSLYKFEESETKEGVFKHSQNITSNGSKNSLCFENGHTEYLILSGRESALFTFMENEFLYDYQMEKLFTDLGEITWVEYLPVQTYREEGLLLIQLKNLTVVGLSWQGESFRVVDLPSIEIDNFQLSKITPIPKYGFIYDGKIVEVDVRLNDLTKPVHDELEKMLQLQNSLEVTFLKQETILNETKNRIQNSYFSNPIITGFWNLTEVKTDTATISENVSFDSLTVGSKWFTAVDVAANLTLFDQQLEELDEKAKKIRHISNVGVPADSPEVRSGGFVFNGGIEVLGTLHVKNLTFKSMNGFTVEEIIQDFVKYDDEDVIGGIKSFSSIEAENVNIVKINGVPSENVLFDTEKKNYENIDFTVLNQLVVNGSLNFSTINKIVWKDLMGHVVWKNRPALIRGLTTVHGEIVADSLSAITLNGLKYPEEYVLQNSTDSAEIVGKKTFGDLKVTNLKGIRTINEIPYEDYVTLNKEQTLVNEITFENLIIDENLQIDGNITGIEMNQEEYRLTLNDVNVVTADTMFTNLYVAGNIIVENSINKRNLSDFDDIIRKSETNAVIDGRKTFLGNVNIEAKLKVTSKKYNGHDIDEFATYTGEQVFPNLRKISAPVTFKQLEYKQLSDLENYLNEFVNNDTSRCSEKKLIFNVSPILEDIGFRSLNGNISAALFSQKIFQTIQNISFENLEVQRLYADSVTPIMINRVLLSDFENHRISISKPQILSGNYIVEQLKAGELKTGRINGMSLNELQKFRNDFEDLFDKIWNGKMTIDTFVVTGRVQTNKINGELLANIYARNELRNVIVHDGFHVQNLEVHGLVNDVNLTEYVSDSVFKTDTNVVLTGEKTVDRINCEVLRFNVLNGNPVESILNSRLPQTLTGQIFAKGNIVVKNSFSSTGKVNDVVYERLIDRFTHLRSSVFELHGNFQFFDNVVIENLQIDGPVQDVVFNSFLDTVIFQNDDVLVSGTKIFTNSVTFRQNFTIAHEYNGLDLGLFNHNAIFIDKEIHIGSKLIFQEDLIVDGELIVQENLGCKTISNVDIEELKTNAIFLDRPSSVQGTLTFTNATFESNMTVLYLNDIDLNAVISLKEDQIIPNELTIGDVSVETLGTPKTLNGYEIDQIFANTFMLYGNQTITGNLIFHGNVKMQNAFDPQFVNGFEMSKIASLDENETLTVNSNHHPLIYALRNTIMIRRWESEAVYTSFPKNQLVKGKWFIRGNVSFEKDVLGKGLLNEIEVQRLYDEVEKRNLMIDSEVTGVKMDLESTCKDLTPLQTYAENQIHRFKFFEYLQIMNFDVATKSVHHFEAEDHEFLLINLEQCFLNTFVYNGSGFTIISSKQDFDMVERWITLIYNDHVYFLTVGNGICGNSYGNLWKFEEQSLTHILDLGNITDAKKIGDYNFLVISEERLEKWSIEDVHKSLYENRTSYFSTNQRMQFIPNTERILLVENHFIHEFDPQYLNHTRVLNHFGNGAILSLQAGIFNKEMFLYYDDGISENNAFIFDGLSDRKIRQSIPMHKPRSFLIINFDGLVETFLTFVENGRSLVVFEYRGIEGFVYRESIKMQIDKTFGFKLRKRSGLSKTNFVAVVYGNTLTILEAKMYGEKLDAKEHLICEG